MGEKTYKESSVLVEFGTRKPILVEDFRSPEEYWQDEAHDKDKEIDRLTAQLRKTEQTLEDTKRSLAERDDVLSARFNENKELYMHWQQALTETTALREEVEQLRVQLAGCGVAAMCNTRESMQQQLCHKGDYGYSASYQDVIDAVKREIDLRNENAALRAEVERLKEESSHLWVRIESGEAAAYEQGKAEARKQTAQEAIEYIRKQTGSHLYKWGLYKELRFYFGLEG